MSATHALYRFHATDGTLLYVGITADPGTRWRAHAHDKPWWQHVTNITVELHPTREAVLEAERAAIIAEKPRHNVIHNRPRTRQAPAPEETFSSLWARQAQEMPDDCHDICVEAGIISLYFPHLWVHGTAHYICDQGHRWTSTWGDESVGAAPQHAGVPAERYTTAVTP